MSNLLKWMLVTTVFLFSVSRVYTYETGAPPGKTGAPGETTCRDCHSDKPLNSPVGSIKIVLYHNGNEVNFFTANDTVSGEIIFHSPHRKTNGGFEISVLNDSTKKDGGYFIVLPNQRLVYDTFSGNVRQYLTHTIGKIDSMGFCRWKFKWVAPDSVKRIKFFVSCNAGNFDHDHTGDYIYNDSFGYFEKAYAGIHMEMHNGHLKIFPNPASEILNIDLDIAGRASTSIDITDLNGTRLAIIMDEQPCSGNLLKQFATSALPNGNYIIRVKSNGIVSNHKLEIIH